MKESYERVEDKNKNIMKNVAYQLEAQSVLEYHIGLLSAMDLERNQLKLYFSHPSTLTVSSATGFKTINLTMDARDIPFPDKINLHRKTEELIYSDLRKASLA